MNNDKLDNIEALKACNKAIELSPENKKIYDFREKIETSINSKKQ